MSVFDATGAVACYEPFDVRDCSKTQFAARLQVCAKCLHRRGNTCSIDGALLSVRARRKVSVCHEGYYPPLVEPVAAAEGKSPGRWAAVWGWVKSQFVTPAAPVEPEPPPRPVRVAFLTPAFRPGGAERWILSLCRWLENEVAGVVSTTDSIDDGMRTELTRLGLRITVQPEEREAARELLNGVDVIVCWGIGDLTEALDGVSTPVVWVAHGACKGTTQIICAARPRVTHWASVSEVPVGVFPVDLQDSVTVIHNGVDIDRVTPVRGRAVARQRLGLREDQIAVGYLGRFSPEKRPEAIAAAVACLPPQFVAVLVGDGWKDAETRAAAERAAPGRVIFTGHQRHVGDVLAAFDVWVNASPSEGMCLSLIEAWLAGVPCVSTPTGAIPELEREYGPLVTGVQIGATGLQIAKAIGLCLIGGRNSATVQRARQLAWERLTSPAMAARWDTYLEGLSVVRSPLSVGKSSHES